MLKFKRFMGEETQLDESHFKVGQKVKCVHSGKEGTVTEVDPSEKGKYYTVKRDDGSIMKYAPDDLEALNEEADLDEAGYKVPKNYASMMAKKRRKAGTSEFGAHPDKKKEVKKEEVELDEIHDRYIRSHGKKASGRGRWLFSTKRMGDVSHKDMYQHPEHDTVSKAAAAARKHFGTKDVYVMEEIDLDETNKGATPARYDMIKRAAQRLQGQEDDPRARRAAKRDMKAKGAQRGMAPVKKDLEEGRNEALKALEGLAKRGGMDKADFQKAHDLYKAGKLNDLRKHIYRLDTDPSEAIASVINRHDSKSFNSMYPRAEGGDYIRSIVLDHGGK